MPTALMTLTGIPTSLVGSDFGTRACHHRSTMTPGHHPQEWSTWEQAGPVIRGLQIELIGSVATANRLTDDSILRTRLPGSLKLHGNGKRSRLRKPKSEVIPHRA